MEFAIFSDSIIMYGSDFQDLLFRLSNLISWVNSFGILFRGGVGYGNHFSEISDKNYLIVSEGLVQAATIEQKIAIYPRIVIHKSVLNAILSIKDINYFTISHYLVQGQDNLWFINPFFLNPDISEIYDFAHKSIIKHTGKAFQDKYIWLFDICEYFGMKYLIRENPEAYYSGKFITKNADLVEIVNKNLFFYPQMYSQFIIGNQFNYNINLSVYERTYDDNVADIKYQHNRIKNKLPSSLP
ncbi:hypothetical protein D0T57_15055 [Dysgonomonas sp. 511]|nr:hypothetical protein [Dysgonomonas sp. 511]